jgi:hypothetical protein
MCSYCQEKLIHRQENMTMTPDATTIDAEVSAETKETQTKQSQSKTYKRQNVAQRLIINKRALDNIRNNPEISAQMAVFGYNSEKINYFEKLYNEAVDANSYQQKEFGEKAEAHSEFEKLFNIAKTEYIGALKVARVAFGKQPEILTKLGANQAQKHTISGLKDQMHTFYDNALQYPDIIQAMSVFSYDQNKLTGFKNNFLNAVTAYSNFYRENTEAIIATKSRDEKIEALDDFYSDLFTIAKLALVNNLQLMKELG